MAHFAKIENNEVIQIAVVENAVIRDVNGDEQESIGVEFLRAAHSEPDAVWIQCSYNHNIRNLMPSVDWSYDADTDAFYPPKPFPSWVWNAEKKCWDSPIGHPTDESKTTWNETDQQWDEVT
jgi:hypothetical protein